MATIGIASLGATSLTSGIPATPTDVIYDEIVVYAEGENVIIDSLWGRNEVISESIINNYTDMTYLPQWSITTYILALFNNTTAGGNIEGITNPITNWLLYRQDTNESKLVFLAELDVEEIEFEDFKALLDKNVRYYLFAKNDTEMGTPLISNYVDTTYWGHFLIDEDNGISYRFNLNSSSSANSYEDDFTEYNTNTKYKTVSHGSRNALKKSIGAVLHDESDCDDVIQSNDLLEEFRDFIITDGSKLYKDKRGRIYRVETHSHSGSQLNENISDQVVVTNFSIVEVGDVYE